MPPLSLQPLVENAVVHGLEPAIDGGSVTVSANDDGGMLRLCVEDDGVGLPDFDAGPMAPLSPRRNRPPGTGTGTALANIAERLRHVHGTAATLRVVPAAGRGVRATLELPLTPSAPRRRA